MLGGCLATHPTAPPAKPVELPPNASSIVSPITDSPRQLRRGFEEHHRTSIFRREIGRFSKLNGQGEAGTESE